jgi:hypothetical protein
MSNVLGLPPLVVALQSSFWTGSVEMGMGTLPGLQLPFGVTRSGSQLGGVNVRVLGLFSNSFPTPQIVPPSPFRCLTSPRSHSLTGGKEAMTPALAPHVARRGALLNVCPLCSAQIPSLNPRSQNVYPQIPLHPILLLRLRVKIPQKRASEVRGKDFPPP